MSEPILRLAPISTAPLLKPWEWKGAAPIDASPAPPCHLCSGLPCRMVQADPPGGHQVARSHCRTTRIPFHPPRTPCLHRAPTENRALSQLRPRHPGPDPTPEAEWTLTFDPVTTVQGIYFIDLGLVWLDDDEEPPRHPRCTASVWARVLKADSRPCWLLAGKRGCSRERGGQRERGGVTA